MAIYVVDTNVFVAAQGDATHLSQPCQQTALSFVRDLGYKHTIAVDQTRKIINEYRNNIPRLSAIDTLLNKMLTTGRIDMVAVAFDDNGDAILPNACQMKDRSDRKFVAVALTHPNKPPICNASDTDWLENEKELNACEVQMMHLCERETREKFAAKQAKGA